MDTKPIDAFDDAQTDDTTFFEEAFNHDAAFADDEKDAENKADAQETGTVNKDDAGGQEDTDAGEGEEPDAGAETTEAKPAEKIDKDEFKGYLDEREKRQKAEAESAALKAQLEQLQQSNRKEEQPTPDIYENPEAFQRSLTQRLEQELDQRLLRDRMNSSEFYARKEHGDELIDEVKSWAQSLSPEQATALTSQPMPYLAAVDAYRQHKAGKELAQFGYDIEALVAKRLEERQAEQPEQGAQDAPKAESAAEQKPQKKFPPRAGQSGGVQVSGSPVSDGEFFEAVFKR